MNTAKNKVFSALKNFGWRGGDSPITTCWENPANMCEV